jgi:hypothetical protein
LAIPRPLLQLQAISNRNEQVFSKRKIAVEVSVAPIQMTPSNNGYRSIGLVMVG